MYGNKTVCHTCGLSGEFRAGGYSIFSLECSSSWRLGWFQRPISFTEMWTSTPVVRTGVYPHMPIADHRETQKVYNTGRHRPCGGMFFTAHTVRDGRASLSHRANERRTCYRFFDFWPWGAYPWVKGHQKGRWPTVHLDLPSYKISARLRKRCSRYALPKLFSLWRWFLTPQGHPGSNLTMAIDSLWVLRISGSWGPTSYLSPFARHFESKFWLWPFDLERANP